MYTFWTYTSGARLRKAGEEELGRRREGGEQEGDGDRESVCSHTHGRPISR